MSSLAAAALFAFVVGVAASDMPDSGACRVDEAGGTHNGCDLSVAYLTSHLRSATAHPALYKELALDEVRCSQHPSRAACLQRRGHCRWDDSERSKGCVALNAVAGFKLQVALCEEEAGNTGSQAALTAERMVELQVESTVATACSLFQLRSDCTAALDGACEWLPSLEFSQDPHSCVVKGMSYGVAQSRLSLRECTATATSNLAHYRYHDLYSICGEVEARESCLREVGCAWRLGVCRPSYSVLLEPIEYVGSKLASEVRSCEALDASLDGCSSTNRGPQQPPLADDSATARSLSRPVPVVAAMGFIFIVVVLI